MHGLESSLPRRLRVHFRRVVMGIPILGLFSRCLRVWVLSCSMSLISSCHTTMHSMGWLLGLRRNALLLGVIFLDSGATVDAMV